MKKLLLVLPLALMLSCIVFSAYAAASNEADEDNIILSTVRPYFDSCLYDSNGNIITAAYVDPVTGVCYAPFSSIASFAGVQPAVECDLETGCFAATGLGLELKTVRGSDYIAVNNRYVHAPGNFFLINDEVCFPVDAVCQIFGIEKSAISGGEGYILTLLETGILSGSEKYYQLTYGYDNIDWLSRIIQAEAEGECFAGKIGVGNVILNRLADPYFPDNIRDIIFDEQVAVQFPPSVTGGVGLPPSDDSMAAACLCFEGVNTAGVSEFFVAPKKADDSWFAQNLTFVARLGNHDFYADPARHG